MNRQSKRTVMPGCHTVDLSDPDERVEPFAVCMEGTTYLPASGWEFGDVFGADGSRMASIFLELPNGFGLHAAMTSVTLRKLAGKMASVAEQIERQAADQAAHALARAARGGTPS